MAVGSAASPLVAPLVAYGICLWSLLFAAPHVYWALGGTIGLAASAGSERIAQDASFVVIGLLGTTALCLAGALFGLAIAQPWGRFFPRWLLFADAAGASALFFLRVVIVEVPLLGYLAGLRSTAGLGPAEWAELRAYAFVWSPYFLLGSLLFGAAAWQLRRPKEAP